MTHQAHACSRMPFLALLAAIPGATMLAEPPAAPSGGDWNDVTRWPTEMIPPGYAPPVESYAPSARGRRRAAVASVAADERPADHRCRAGKYEFVRITETPYLETHQAINNLGQIVFVQRLDNSTDDSREIMLYDHGVTTRLTDDDVNDSTPDINDLGIIVWSRHIGPDGDYGPTGEIVVLENGILTQLTQDEFEDIGPSINNLGHIVWTKHLTLACGARQMDLFWYDGAEIHRLTTDGQMGWGIANQAAQINDLDQIAWTRYDFCESPWDSDIALYDDGAVRFLDPADNFEPQSTSINNAGHVAWATLIEGGPPWEQAIELWQDGTSKKLSDFGSNPSLNNVGLITFYHSFDDGQTSDIWIYCEGSLFALTDGSERQIVPMINDPGEIVWKIGRVPSIDLRASLLRLSSRSPGGGLQPPGEVQRVTP